MMRFHSTRSPTGVFVVRTQDMRDHRDNIVSSEQVLAALPEGVVVIDPAGIITSANPAALRILLDGAGELVGLPVAQFLSLPAGWADLGAHSRAGTTSGADAVPAGGNEFEHYCERRQRWFEVRVIPAGASRVATIRDVTAHRLAERTLRASEQHYRGLVESAEEGFWLLDVHGRTSYVNGRMAHMLGYEPDEMLGRHLFEFMDEPGQRIAAPKLSQRRLGTREQHEFEFIRRDGTRIWTLISAGPMYDERGQYIGALAGVTDISDRKAIEEKLTESEQRYRFLTDFIPQMVWLSDGKGYNLHCNRRCLDYLGLSLEELTGEGWLCCVHPEDLARTRRTLQAAWERGEPYELELRLRRGSDGLYCWHLEQAVPFRDVNGRITYWLGTSTDIEDRKRTEAALQASEHRYRVLADSIPHMVWTTDAQGHVTYCSESAIRYTGLARHQLTGEGWLELVHPEDRPRLLATLSTWSQRREPYEAEVRLRRASDGSYRWHLQRAAPIIGEDGQVVEWIGTGTDIEDLKQVEIEVRQARDQAEEAVAAKNRFLALISHELRTPLASILLWAKLLRSAAIDEAQQRTALETIIQCATDQSRLVADLLDVARGVHGRLVVDAQPLDFTSVVQSTVDRLSPDFTARSVALTVALADARVRGDASRLQQMVSNLLCNAMEFTPGGGQVSVAMRCSTDHCVLEIRDTGEGLAPELLPRVFDLFWQADPSSSRRHPGMGLGLYIVRQITEAHGGSVAVASDGLGQGCTFSVTLPLLLPIAVPGDDGGGQSAVAASDMIDPGLRRLDGARILVVDDDASLLRSIAATLASCGAEERHVTGGLEALRALEQWTPDVVVADLAMPEMDGIELARRIRGSQRHIDIPMIAMSAHTGEEDQARARSSGFNVYLAKPFTPETLVQEIARLMAERDRGA